MNTLDAISLAESRERIELERDIDAGKKTFIKVGVALARIRDARLYRDEYSTFEKYAEARFGFKRSYTYQLIESAGIANQMSAIADIPNEATARELAKVEPTQRAEVLARAAESGTVTAKSIRQAAAPESAISDNQQTPPDLGAQFVKACGLTSADEIVQDLKYNLEMAKDDINCIVQKITAAEWDAKAIGQAALELRVTAGKLEKLKRKIEVSK
jgi:hypothetical protein